MKKIDLSTWSRQKTFDHFNSYEYPQFNVCAQLDITKTFEYLTAHNISKYNAVLWMVSHAANGVAEIRYRIRQGGVVEHDRVDPSFAVLTDEGNLAFCAVEYGREIREFFYRVEQGIAETKANPTMDDEPGVDNLLYISCIPWINFTSISHPLKVDSTDCIPRISWGKFTEKRGEVSMPVSLQLHHGLADGYHAGLFFEQMEKLLHDPEAIGWPID